MKLRDIVFVKITKISSKLNFHFFVQKQPFEFTFIYIPFNFLVSVGEKAKGEGSHISSTAAFTYTYIYALTEFNNRPKPFYAIDLQIFLKLFITLDLFYGRESLFGFVDTHFLQYLKHIS